MSNLITEIYDKQAVVDNLNQLGELINSSLNAIVASAPKLQSPIEYLTAVQSISEIEKKNTEVTQAKAKALSDLDKAYQQADKAIQQSINLDDAEFQTQTKLTSQYKERAKEQRQLLELERTRQQTMQNSAKLLSMEAKTEAELRMQQQQLIKASQSLRITNAEENKLREQLIAKINANREALKGMTNEVSKQKDNIGNYKSALEGVSAGMLSVREAIRMTTIELTTLEAKQAAGAQLTREEAQRYAELNDTLGKLKDVQSDVSQRTQALADDHLAMTAALQGVGAAVGGITAVSGAMALFGIENKKAAATIQKLTGLMSILQGLQAVEKALNKDSALMTALRAASQKKLNQELGNTVVAEGAGTAATASFTAAEGAATVGAITLRGAVKAVGTAIKSVPVIGWILAAISAIITLIGLITDSNDEEERGNEILDQKKQLLDDIYDAYRKNLDSIMREGELLRENIKLLKNQTDANLQYVDTYKKLSDYTGLSVDYLKTLTEKQLLQIENDYEILAQQKESLANSEKELKTLEQQNAAEWEISRTKDFINALNKAIVTSETKILGIRQKEYDWLNDNKRKAQEAADAQKAHSQAIKDTNEKYDILIAKLKTDYFTTISDLTDRELLEWKAKALQIHTIELEIQRLTDLNKLLSSNSKEYANNVAKIAELKFQYDELAVAEEDVDEENERILKSMEKKKSILEETVIPAEQLYGKALDEITEKILAELDAEENAAEKRKQIQQERVNATMDALNNLNDAAKTLGQEESDRLDQQMKDFEDYYARRKNIIENTVLDEEVKNRRLQALENEKVAKERQIAKQRAEIERRQAIFQNAVDSATAMSKAISSVGLLLVKETEGDTYSAVARYIAAIAAGVSAVTTVSTLITKLLNIPAFERGGTAEANKPFIAGEKGREIGFGVYSGKVYDFSKPTLFKANEPINIKNATETRQIINNNEYNKDVTLHNEISVQVIDNTRINKFFKIW